MTVRIEVGDKVKIVGMRNGNGKHGVITKVYKNGSVSVSVGDVLPEHTHKDDDNFHLAFYREEVEPIPTTAVLQLEVGKYYKTRDGRKVGPMRRTGLPEDNMRWNCIDGGGWTEAGTVYNNYLSDGDLIAEWIDTPTTGTLAEIGAQVGDVVESDEYRATFKVTSIDGEIAIGTTHYGDCEIDDDVWSMDGIDDWRIISRATPAPASPVITETVTTKRIVPGVYGKVVVASGGTESVAIAIGSELGPEWMSRPDLIAARDTLNQLIDALPST